MKNTVEIYINDSLIDLNNDGVRLNNTLFTPTKLTATTTSYSYSFKIPLTPNNAVILGNVNALSKRNKFNQRYRCRIITNGIEIFNGSGKIANIKGDEVSFNAYIPKINQLDEIFGEDPMTNIEWYVPFDGVKTINSVNLDASTKYFFPMVAYGLFQKDPFSIVDGYATYSDKKLIDEWVNFHYNSFVPSVNLVELMTRAFRQYGYELEGDVRTDAVLNEIFLSNYISQEQDPLYNQGNQIIGECEFDLSFANCPSRTSKSTIWDGDVFENEWDYERTAPYIVIDWTSTAMPELGKQKAYYKPPKKNTVYNMFSAKNGLNPMSTITNIKDDGNFLVGNGYNENLGKDKVSGLQIPSDGWYEIEIDLKDCGIPRWFTLKESTDYANTDGVIFALSPTYSDCEFEFQLLRYGAEMGSDFINHNPMYIGIYPNEAPEIPSSDANYPFEKFRYQQFKHRTDDWAAWILFPSVVAVDKANNPNYLCGMSASDRGVKCGYLKNGRSWNSSILKSESSLYDLNGEYFPRSSSMFDWDLSKSYSGYYKVGLKSDGSEYDYTTAVEVPNYNKNTLPNNKVGTNGYSYNYIEDVDTSNPYAGASGVSLRKRINGKMVFTVKLSKNDVLVPYIQVKRQYEYMNTITNQNVVKELPIPLQCDMHFKIRSVASNKTESSKISYGMKPIEDTIQLNLGNFLNKEQKITDFISSVQKAFNLDFQLIGRTVKMNKNKKHLDTFSSPINIDDRVNNSEVTSQPIEYPKKASVQFKIDTDEEGFYRSVPNDLVERDDWTNYGYYGYDEVNVSNTDDSKDLSLNTNFSYCWYNDFKIVEKYSKANCNRIDVYNDFSDTLSLPIIGSNEWWIENYNYEENEQYDGRSKTQRFWFRGSQKFKQIKEKDLYIGGGSDKIINAPLIVPVNSRWYCFKATDDEGDEYYERQKETYGFDNTNSLKYDYRNWYQVTLTSNEKEINGKTYHLDYEDKDGSLLLEYFNVTDLDSSNDSVEVEIFLQPSEYKDILNGRQIQFNDDVYTVLKVQGFDTSGNKRTKLTLLQT